MNNKKGKPTPDVPAASVAEVPPEQGSALDALQELENERDELMETLETMRAERRRLEQAVERGEPVPVDLRDVARYQADVEEHISAIDAQMTALRPQARVELNRVFWQNLNAAKKECAADYAEAREIKRAYEQAIASLKELRERAVALNNRSQWRYEDIYNQVQYQGVKVELALFRVGVFLPYVDVEKIEWPFKPYPVNFKVDPAEPLVKLTNAGEFYNDGELMVSMGESCWVSSATARQLLSDYPGRFTPSNEAAETVAQEVEKTLPKAYRKLVRKPAPAKPSLLDRLLKRTPERT